MMEAHIPSAVEPDTWSAPQLRSPATNRRGEDHTGPVLAALGGFAAIAVNTALMLGVRRGLPDNPGLITLLVGYASLFVCCSVGIEIRVAGALRRALAQLLALIALLALPIVFFGTALWLLVPAGCLGAWIVVDRSRLAALRVQRSMIAWLGSALCCVILIGLFGIAGFQHGELQAHFLMPEYGRLGLLHKDPLTFVTFAAEIMNGRWPGAALDGMRPIFYHFGVPLVFASLGLASGSSAFQVYMAGQQVLFVPLVVFYAGLAASALAGCAGAPVRARALSVVLGVAAVLVVPTLNWPVVYYSESSAAAAPLAFMMLPLAAALLSSDAGPARSLVQVLGLIAASLASALFKFSTAVTIGAWAGYLILRHRLSEPASNVVTMLAFGLAVVIAVGLWPALFGRDFLLWDNDSYFPRVRDDAIWALGALGVALVLQQACRALQCDLERMGPVWRASLVMVPLAVAGAWLIANVQHVYDSRYLFNNLLLLALPLIAVNAAALLNGASLRFEHAVPGAMGRTLPVAAILLVLFTTLGMEAGRAPPSRAAATINTATDAMCRRAVPESQCRAGVPRAFRAFPAEAVVALEGGIGPRILAVLQQSHAAAADALFVPPGNETYWQFVLGGARPFDNMNFLPAHFGMPMLLGLPPARHGVDVNLISRALLGRYGDSARSRQLSDGELCRHARERRTGRIVVFEALEGPASVRLLDCGTQDDRDSEQRPSQRHLNFHPIWSDPRRSGWFLPNDQMTRAPHATSAFVHQRKNQSGEDRANADDRSEHSHEHRSW
jgi:hypothetical protein